MTRPERSRHWRRAAAAAAILLPALALGGCYESPSFKTHSPGEYQGKRDSDTIMHPDDEQRAALKDRFRAVQTDR